MYIQTSAIESDEDTVDNMVDDEESPCYDDPDPLLFDFEDYIEGLLFCFDLKQYNKLLFTFTEVSVTQLASSNGDFSPFASVCEALVFILIHSPRPVVS